MPPIQPAPADENSYSAQPSHAVTGNQVLRSTVYLPLSPIQQRLDQFFFAPPPGVQVSKSGLPTSGIASGDGESKFSLWSSANYGDMRNTLTGSDYKGYSGALAIGGDYSFAKGWVAGLSVGRDRTLLDTPYNSGYAHYRGSTASVYLGGELTSWLRLNVAAGVSDSKAQQRRLNPITGLRVDGEQKIKRDFVQASLSTSHWVGRWNLAPSLGYLIANDRSDAFTESDGTVQQGRKNRFEQLQLGIKASYWLDGFMPYAEAVYLYDTKRQLPAVVPGQPVPGQDRDSVRLGFGVQFQSKSGWLGSLTANTELMRANTRNIGIAFTVGKRF